MTVYLLCRPSGGRKGLVPSGQPQLTQVRGSCQCSVWRGGITVCSTNLVFSLLRHRVKGRRLPSMHTPRRAPCIVSSQQQMVDMRASWALLGRATRISLSLVVFAPSALTLQRQNTTRTTCFYLRAPWLFLGYYLAELLWLGGHLETQTRWCYWPAEGQSVLRLAQRSP